MPSTAALQITHQQCFITAHYGTRHAAESLPELEIEQAEVSGENLTLGVGRPRIPAETVYVFLMLRGFRGSLSTKQSRRFLRDSMSLYGWLQSRGLTILDNLNVISRQTRELIFNRQIPRILGEGLDDSDLGDAERGIEYASDRVFHEKKLPSTEKVLSLSDGSAAYIKKGDRHPLIGYKLQLVRSENGFVTSLLVPEGNAADAITLVPAIADSIQRTGVVADLAGNWLIRHLGRSLAAIPDEPDGIVLGMGGCRRHHRVIRACGSAPARSFAVTALSLPELTPIQDNQQISQQ
jgi:hypothetical protein